MAAIHQPVPAPGLRLDVKRYAILALVVAGILGAIWVLDGGKADQAASDTGSVTLTGIAGGVTPRIGEAAPDFTLQDPSGKPVSLSGFRGHPVFVNFWASWCPPCRSEMPDIQALAQENAGRGLVVLGVNMQEDTQPVVRYAQTLGLTFPLALDRNGAVATRYNVTGLPTSYVVDEDGVIRAMNIGPLPPKGLRAKLASVLGCGERPTRVPVRSRAF